MRRAQDPRIWFGRFASAEFVMKSAHHRDILASEYQVITFEMEGAGTWDYLPTIIVKGACDYADSHKNKEWQAYSAITAAACAKAIVEEWRPVLPQPQMDNPGASRKRRFSTYADCERRGAHVLHGLDMEEDALDNDNLFNPAISPTILLHGLSHVAKAAFHSFALPDTAACLENTRVALLKDVEHWATTKDSQPVFWLQGIAGTGKTTIAKTIARTFSENSSLAASFFFSRGAGDRGNATKLIGTLIHQLCTRSTLEHSLRTELQTIIHQTIRATPDITTKAYGEQWEHLFMRPLMMLQCRFPTLRWKHILVVIDALDECDPVQDIGLIIELLVQTRQFYSIPIRFFLTGRPEVAVSYHIQRIKGNVDCIVLHNIERSVVECDILTLVRHQFGQISEKLQYSPGWPSSEQILIIVSRARGLFIYAATVCRVIGSSHSKHLLRQFLVDDKRASSHLAHMYNLIIAQGLGRTDTDFVEVTIPFFRLIIGSLAALVDNLSINVLHMLLTSHPPPAAEPKSLVEDLDPDTVKDTLRQFSSVLDIPDNRDLPVRIFHPSFREYLFSSRAQGVEHSQLQPSDVHEHLLCCCFAILHTDLRKDICRLVDPSANSATVDGANLAQYLPPHAQYACKYWISHMESLSGAVLQSIIADDGPFDKFCGAKILYWLEAMSLLRMIPVTIQTVAKLLPLFSNNEIIGRSTLVLRDTFSFLVNNRVIIEQSPLQIYCSALLFSPSRSLLRDIFANEIPNWLSERPDVSEYWPISVTMDASAGEARAIDLSADGTLLVSAHSEPVICVWDVATGFLIRKIETHAHDMWSIAFTPNARIIASGFLFPRHACGMQSRAH
ncbi:hypothetical protein BJX70DRAFT_11388 [Aspergillus crustosus]